MPHVLIGSASMQDYVEVILDLTEGYGSARVSDIADRLDVTKPSVTQMMDSLKKEGLVEQEPYGPVKLTSAGRELAAKVRLRHRLLKKFLVETLDVDPAVADQDACLMEHVVSPETMEKLAEFLLAASVIKH
ncbi:MAG: metal-dependent transcriptional regulator [Firmicutes bacterium]|nr:metal-dependent transcriptional regulator [Bacillota bacterium]